MNVRRYEMTKGHKRSRACLASARSACAASRYTGRAFGPERRKEKPVGAHGWVAYLTSPGVAVGGYFGYPAFRGQRAGMGMEEGSSRSGLPVLEDQRETVRKGAIDPHPRAGSIPVFYHSCTEGESRNPLGMISYSTTARLLGNEARSPPKPASSFLDPLGRVSCLD